MQPYLKVRTEKNGFCGCKDCRKYFRNGKDRTMALKIKQKEQIKINKWKKRGIK